MTVGTVRTRSRPRGWKPEQNEVLETFAATLAAIAALPPTTHRAIVKAYVDSLAEPMRNWLAGEISLTKFETLISMSVGRHLHSSAGGAFDEQRPRRAPKL